MIDVSNFKRWLTDNTNYSNAVITDIASRAKRADSLVEWFDDDLYLFHLEKNEMFKALSVSVKSQLRRAVKLYNEYQSSVKTGE